MAARSTARHSVRFRLVTLALMLVQAACAHRSKLNQRFDAAAFKRSPTVLAGVAILAKGPDVGLVNPEHVNAMMEAKFRNGRPDLSFVGMDVLRERIGYERYVELIDRYRSGAGIDTSTYAMLAEAMGADARYLALARIDSVSVTRVETTRDPDYDAKTDNNEVVKTTNRNVWIRLNLYDLEARREIWSAIQTGSTSTHVSFPEDRTGGSRGVLLVMKVLFKSDPDYPPPPGPYGASEVAFSRLAKQIPKR